MEKAQSSGEREKNREDYKSKRYDAYKRGRDLAWETLIKCGINTLPVALDKVAAVCGLRIISFNKAERDGLIEKKCLKGRLVTAVVDGKKTVFVDSSLDSGTARFYMAKGIGRCLLLRDPEKVSRGIDYEATVFARDLLMPAIALFVLGARTADEIQALCLVSQRAAVARAKRMEELIARGKFNAHPLERQVGELFVKSETEKA